MKINKLKLILGILASVFCVLLMILQQTMGFFEPYSLENTTEFSATVSEVQHSTYGDCMMEIQTYEYQCTLMISGDVRQYVNETNLQEGDDILFRIANVDLEQFETFTFVHIVSLKTETTDILALSDYNLYAESWKEQAKISVAVVMLLLLGMSIYCWATLKKKN